MANRNHYNLTIQVVTISLTAATRGARPIAAWKATGLPSTQLTSRQVRVSWRRREDIRDGFWTGQRSMEWVQIEEERRADE